jgi:hypothetical protein
MFNIISEKGATEMQLLAIVGIILGFILLIFGWLFIEELSDVTIDLFTKMTGGVKDKICDVFGVFGQTIGKLFGCG